MEHIKNNLSNHNKSLPYPQITEVTHIPAKVKIVKFKFEQLPFDLSINNFVGLYKLFLMNFLETNYFNYEIFKRTLILIKTWAYYEGNILGSNVGLMASYALEVLVIYMFNFYSDKFTNEIQAIMFFFQLIGQVNWDTHIVTIFGMIEIEKFNESVKNGVSDLNTLMKEEIEKNTKDNINSKIKIDKLTQFLKSFENSPLFDKSNYDNLPFFDKSNFDNRHYRCAFIIDPIFHTNNLGKSVSAHNLSKIEHLFSYVSQEVQYVNSLKKQFSICPYNYLSFMIKMFTKIIINNNPKIFYANMFEPKIMLLPSEENCNEELQSGLNTKKQEETDEVIGIGENSITKFNKCFTKVENTTLEEAKDNEKK